MNNILSSHIDPNKIFIINRSEIEGRWDPSVYKNIFVFTSKTYPEYKLSEVALINPNTSFRDLDDNSEITFIPMDAIDETNGVVTKTYYRKVSEYKGYTKFKEGDLIWAKITPCMQNGNSAIIRNAKQGYGFGSTEFFVIRPKNDNVLIEYIYILLRDQRILNNAMNYFGGSAGQQRVPKEFLINFRLPLPPIEMQRKVINLYSDACVRKQQKEAQATALLASIDDYLLGELGINLPDQDNSLKSRIFTTLFSEVVGNRIDPKLYDNNTQSLWRAIRNTHLHTSKLRELIIHSVSGDWGEEEISDEDYTKCLVIRATEFDNNYNLNLDNTRVKHRFIRNDKLVKMDMRPGDLLIEKSGGSPDQPVGRIAIVNQDYLADNELAFSNFIHKIRVNTEQINPEYLFCFLKTMHSIKLTDAMQSQTNGIRNLIMSNYYNQHIPLPPLEKQNEIAEHIQSIRNQARSLQKEAQEILEKAKKEVEQIILGE